MKPKLELAQPQTKEDSKEALVEKEAHYYETMFLTSLLERQKLLKPEIFKPSNGSKKE